MPLVLVGYSGGGLLASYLAREMEEVVGLITIAGNLDLGNWISKHGYTHRLLENTPELILPFPEHLSQLHVFGGQDTNAPYQLSKLLLQSDRNAAVMEISTADHDCCWVQNWPAIWGRYQQLTSSSVSSVLSSTTR